VPKDTRPFVALTDEFPEHPKVIGLSDAAFRAQVELICWSNRNRRDGQIPPGLARKYDSDVIDELLTEGLIESDGKGYSIHDYLEHNPSKVEIEERIAEKRERGSKGGKSSAHKRWHLDRGVIDPDCDLCVTG
jgi:hypothetical protein